MSESGRAIHRGVYTYRPPLASTEPSVQAQEEARRQVQERELWEGQGRKAGRFLQRSGQVTPDNLRIGSPQSSSSQASLRLMEQTWLHPFYREAMGNNLGKFVQ